MSTPFAALEEEALKLSPQERVLLADHLLASLGPPGEIEAAWAEEVQRRLAEVESGHVPLVPLEQALAQARQAIL